MKRYAFILLLCAGCIVQAPQPIPDDNVPGPTPIPAKTVDALVHQAMKDYASRMSAAFGNAQAASHEKAADANTALATANKAARQSAFAPVDKLIDDRIGGEKWDADEAEKLFGELSAAFKKAVK